MITKKDVEHYNRLTQKKYKQKCHNKNCDNEIILYTQRDDCPEYYTIVGIRCNKCNCKIWFKLPVN